MEPGTQAPRDRVDPRRIMVIGAIGGMLAGMMMAMVEMLYGWVSDGRTFWDAPMAIWAWVGGLDWFGDPGDHIGSIILGMGGHMMNSMIAGIVFAAIMTLIGARNLIGSVMLGVAYGLGLWAIMRYAILPLNDPESTLFTTDRVSPAWVWWLSHAALGMTAGMFFHAASNVLGGRPVQRRRMREAHRVA